jgi:hypothetical protein
LKIKMRMLKKIEEAERREAKRRFVERKRGLRK